MNHRRLILALALLLPGSAAAGGGPGAPNPDAPPELAQFGRFVGTWHCTSSWLQPDGDWRERPGRSTWRWFYILNGFAIQDIWLPPDGNAPPDRAGTNVRVYDSESGEWHIAWTTAAQHEFDLITATQHDDDMVMRMQVPARPALERPAHQARITFHNISAEHFDWRYEAAAAGGEPESWREVNRLSCDRAE